MTTSLELMLYCVGASLTGGFSRFMYPYMFTRKEKIYDVGKIDIKITFFISILVGVIAYIYFETPGGDISSGYIKKIALLISIFTFILLNSFETATTKDFNKNTKINGENNGQ